MASVSNIMRALMAGRAAGWEARQAWWCRYHGWVLAALWLLVQLLLLVQHHGPHYVSDSGRYLAYGKRIAEEWYFEHDHNLRYVGYPLFISLWLWLGAGFWGIVLGQIAISGLAAWGLYDALHRLSGSRLPAALGVALFILWPDTQQLNVYLLTESLFTSFTLLSFWALVRTTDGTAVSGLRLLLLLGLAAIVRPNGFMVPVAGLVSGLAYLYQRPNRRPFWLGLLGLLLLLPVGWWLLNKLLLTFTLIETYARGEIIYGYSAWVLQPAAPLQLPPSAMAPVLRLGYFILHNPGFFAQLALLKLGTFFSYVKTYYSWPHNLAIVAFIYPCYWLAWRGVRRSDIRLPIRLFLLAVVWLQGFIVMLTVESWEMRFLIPVLPCVFALAALGAQPYLPKLASRLASIR